MRIVLGEWEKCGNVEHDLMFLEVGEVRMGAGHVIVGVQASAVLCPPFEPDLFSQQIGEVTESRAALLVGQELIVRGLGSFGVDDPKF